MEDVKKSYLESDQDLRVRRSIAGCILSALLFPAGISLDYFVYPGYLGFFFILRAVCSVATLCILTFHYNLKLRKHVKLLTFSWMILAQIVMCYMIFITEGYSSTYYAGLNLTILGTGVLLPLSALEVFVFCLSTLILYLASACQANIESFGILFNNIYFLLLTSIISITAAFFNSKFRFKEFCLNYELRETISTLQSTRAQLVHSEKINAIGRLSAGLLHEINNPLNYTITALQFMKMDAHIKTDPEMKETMLDIEEGMMRIKTIVTDLRAFAYPEEADKKSRFAILEAVDNTLRFTASECHNVKRIVNVENGIMVLSSKTHIVQVLINLISNACKAVSKAGKEEEGGIITIEVRKEKNRAILSVSDNGTGMNEETLKKIFDPFFTTNEIGKGMGLGLSISHTIIQNHGGSLKATSELGKGSTFFFDLPCEE